MFFGGLINFLEKPDAIRYVLMRLLFILGNENRVIADYELSYGRDNEPPRPMVKEHSSGRAVAEPPSSPQWRPFPKCPVSFKLFRSFNNLYMCYIVVKYFFSAQVRFVLGHFIELRLPIHCYLVGRYIIYESLAESTATLFSIAFLAWRLSQMLAGPHRINLVYFLMMHDNDREWLESRLESRQLELAIDKNYVDRFSAAERFVIDTMCYKVVYSSKIVFKLRANRTRETNLKLRRRLARLALVGIIIYLVVSSVLSTIFPIMHLLDQRYLRVYPNCDPQLEQLNREGKISTWSMTLNTHHKLTFLADITENSVVWFESGLVTIIAPILVYMCNYDLTLHWLAIRRKIEALERATRSQPHWAQKYWPPCQKLRYELSAEIADFISQVELAHRLMAQVLNATLVGSLGFCSVYSYLLVNTAASDRLPLPIFGALLFTGTSAFFCLQSFLMVHNVFNGSYTTLCSLMVHDRENQVINYGAILQFFVEHRDCPMMMNKFRFVPTTFLTLIGWTFTCFCFSIKTAIS